MSTLYISEKELAIRWSMSNRTLQRWRSEVDDLPYFKIGGLVRYSLAILEAYEAKHTHLGNFTLPTKKSTYATIMEEIHE
jgi:hypothetical protein